MWNAFKSLVITIGLIAVIIAAIWLSYIVVLVMALVLLFAGIKSYLDYQKENS